MNRVSPRGLAVLAFLLLALFSPCHLGRAAEAPPSESDLKRKQEEVDRLKKELDQAQGELKKIQKENIQLRDQQEKAKAEAAKAAARPAPKPARPIASLPALRTGDEVPVDELVGQFANETAAAEARYTGQRLRLRGEIAGFGSKLFMRVYEVLLQSPDRGTRVVCHFNYADEYQAVYTEQHGRVLVARLSDVKVRPLLRAGDPIVLEGRCKGLKHNELLFTGCGLPK